MEIKRLSFAYKNKKVLKDISLTFEKGQITTLMGANGSGKSTLFKLCTRQLRPRLGKITLGGEDIYSIDNKAFARQVAIVHQQNKILGDISVRDLVSYGRQPYSSFMKAPSKEDQEEIDRAIDLCGLKDIENSSIKALSGGQSQRAWIAMAIAQRTQVLFLDEPTTYLDIRYQIEILDLVKRLNQEANTTIIMVLHDINQSIEYSHRLIGLNQGSIAFEGRVKDVLNSENMTQIYGIDLEIKDIEDRKLVLASR